MNRDTANDLSHVMHSLGRHKIATATVERSPTDGSGRFTAIVSTFGPPPDVQGDIIAPGAFLKSIVDWRARDMRPTVWWQHDYKNPSAAIGLVERMYETDDGLVIEAQLDLDHEPALAVYEGLLAGRLKEFSIGFAIIAEHREGGFNVLDEVELLEVSVVYAGSNRYTRLIDIKTASTSTVASTTTDVAEWNLRIDEVASTKRVVTDAARNAADTFITAVHLEMVEEKLAEARASSFDAELNERAANPGPVPEFDKRFAVMSVPTEHESGDTEPEQVVGYQSETFRIAVLPGTMRPDNE
jgi:HK97 family phage prohead protease